ncbi:MAG TPA: alpha/beta hydrolase [Anaerolineales bacterium]|nr:alpha/beta hydrolase [Anaerolineales bacterium]
MSIPSLDFGGHGLPLHFLHANGYPPESYQPLLQLMAAQYHVFGMFLRPLWPDSKPEEVKDWHIFSDDLLKFLDEQKTESIIGVGHSIGAIVTLRAALREPNRFRALILFDPVLFPPNFIFTWNVLRMLKLSTQVHPKISGALKRRRTFDDLDTVFRGYRRREVFRFFSDESLRAYIEGMTQTKADGGFELVFSPEWETRIYSTGISPDMDLWRGLPRLNVPMLIIRGAQTDTFREDAARLVKRKQPKVRIETLEQSTHLLPLERPQEVFDLMQSFLKEIL